MSVLCIYKKIYLKEKTTTNLPKPGTPFHKFKGQLLDQGNTGREMLPQGTGSLHRIIRGRENIPYTLRGMEATSHASQLKANK